METLRAVEWGVGTQQIEQDRCLPVHAADLRPEEESEDKTIAELTRPGHVLKIKRNEKRKLIYLQLKCRARAAPEAICCLHGLEELSLEDNALAELPKALHTLHNLWILHLSRNQLTGSSLLAVSRISQLERLYLAYNNLTEIPQQFRALQRLRILILSGNQLTGSSLEPVWALSSLEILGLNQNNLTELPRGLRALCNLRTLYLNNNQLSAVSIEAIYYLSMLEEVWLEKNNFGEFPVFLWSLPKLKILSIQHNQLKGSIHLPSLNHQLPNIQAVYLTNNNLTRIDLRIFDPAVTPSLRNFRAEKNSLKQPPQELVDSCSRTQTLQDLRWYASQEHASYFQMKLCVVGKESAGKTVLTHRLMRNHKDAQHCLDKRQSTRGVHHELWKNPLNLGDSCCEAAQLMLMVWDYAGQHTYRSTHQCFFTSQALYLLVFDLNEDRVQSAACVVHWLYDIEERVPGAVFVLIGTKADLLSSHEARSKYKYVLNVLHSRLQIRNRSVNAQSLSKPHGSQALVIPEAADQDSDTWIVGCTDEYMTSGCIDRVRHNLVMDVILHHRERFPHLFEARPVAWLRILEAIFNCGRTETMFVQVEVIQRQARATRRELEMALQFLHEAGICLWYEENPVLREYVLHDPVHVSELLRMLVDSPRLQTSLEQNPRLAMTDVRTSLQMGLLSADIVPLIWEQSYRTQDPPLRPQQFSSLVLSLLERLDLTFEAPLAQGKYFVPLLLPVYGENAAEIIRRKKTAKRIWGADSVWQRPVHMLRMRFSSGRPSHGIPHGLFERLIVRLYRARGEMLAEDEFPSNHAQCTWELYRNCLTDYHWFALFVEDSDTCEIVLRIDCATDTRAFRPESCCFKKRVWDTVCAVVRQSYGGVLLSTYIVLEDWERPDYSPADVTFALDDIFKDDNGFVIDAEQLLGNTQIAARELWPQRKTDHPFIRRPNEALEHCKLRVSPLLLGTGTFGRVFKGSYDGFPVAVKQLDPPSLTDSKECNDLKNEEIQMVHRECSLHRQLQCRTVLKMFGVCEHQGHVYLVLEYARHGSLRDVCRHAPISTHDRNEQGLDMSLRQRILWLIDIMEAVCYLHERSVLHRDIKCENVMIREDMTALLGDFGLSRQFSNHPRASSGMVGTCIFRAPEVSDVPAIGYSFAADIYSFGVTAMELLLSYCPPSRDVGLQEVDQICQTRPVLALNLNKLRKIAENCTTRNPCERPKASAVFSTLKLLIS